MATINSDFFNTRRSPVRSSVANVAAHMKATAQLTTAFAANDVINMFSLPAGAVITGCQLQAGSQLDSATSLTLDVGIAGTAQLFVAAAATVGRAAGVSGVSGVASGGTAYKNTTGKDLPIIVTCHATAGTAVAGPLTLIMSYFVEDATGSAA